MPADCGSAFWDGNTDIFEIPSKCCTPEYNPGVFEWLPFSAAFPNNEKVKQQFPFGAEVPIAPVIMSACAADGTQFYGEKCTGSDFSGAPGGNAFSFGDCGEPDQPDSCYHTVSTQTPGACFMVASPGAPPFGNTAVLMRAGGCILDVEPTTPFSVTTTTRATPDASITTTEPLAGNDSASGSGDNSNSSILRMVIIAVLMVICS